MPAPSHFEYAILIFATCMLGSSLIVGCSKPPEAPETVVTGAVTYQGRPVTGGSIIFLTEGPDGKQPYYGEIYDDGTYELTFIVPGDAQVAVDTGTKKGLPTFVELPRKYSSPSQSGQSYTVIEGPKTYNVTLD